MVPRLDEVKALVALLVIGLVIYALVWLVQSRPGPHSRGSSGPTSDRTPDHAHGRAGRPGPTPSHRPIGPDDDPDFLRGL